MTGLYLRLWLACLIHFGGYYERVYSFSVHHFGFHLRKSSYPRPGLVLLIPILSLALLGSWNPRAYTSPRSRPPRRWGQECAMLYSSELKRNSKVDMVAGHWTEAINTPTISFHGYLSSSSVRRSPTGRSGPFLGRRGGGFWCVWLIRPSSGLLEQFRCRVLIQWL
jgi:hypothetical protein